MFFTHQFLSSLGLYLALEMKNKLLSSERRGTAGQQKEFES